MSQLQSLFKEELQLFEAAFSTSIEKLYNGNSPLDQVCRYALEGQGKRVRPLLCMLTHRLFSESEIEKSLPAAVALEYVHTYSLVHDDLPCMDDDDLRRGRPTVHIEFDESSAVLAGDALLTDAFKVLSDNSLQQNKVPLDVVIRWVETLATHAGSSGMIAGQALDLAFEKSDQGSFERLQEIHSQKTGKLMGAAMEMGAATSNQPKQIREEMFSLGMDIGLLFQVVDDLIDDLPGTGKTAGKDAGSQKLTYLSFHSREECQNIVREGTDRVLSKIADLQPRSGLASLVELLCDRRF